MTEAVGISLNGDRLGGTFDGGGLSGTGNGRIALVDIMNNQEAFMRSPPKCSSFDAWLRKASDSDKSLRCDGELSLEEPFSALDSTREEDFEDPFCHDGDFDSDVEMPMPAVEAEENLQGIAEYVDDIFSNVTREDGGCREPKVQPELDAETRASAVDWLVEVQMKYHLKRETLFLAVSILDRYLTTKRVPRQDLRLVACTAAFIAAKFEENSPPDVRDFVFLTKEAPDRPSVVGQPCSKEALLEMEVKMLTALEFCLCRPTAAHFLQKYLRVNRCSEAHHHLLQYLLELALLDLGMTRFSPSIQAVAAALISSRLLKLTPAWPEALERRTKSTEVLVGVCAREMLALLQAPERSSLQQVRKKFLRPDFSRIAAMCMDEF